MKLREIFLLALLGLIVFVLVFPPSVGEIDMDKVSFGTLSDDSAWAGTAEAEVQNELQWSPSGEFYHWTPLEVFFPDRDCVTVGKRVVKITFYARHDYEWRVAGAEVCLSKK